MSASNSKLTKKKITLAFKDHDINDTGYLDGDYLYKALISLNVPIEPSDIPSLFESVCREKQQTVELEDFLDIVMELKGDEDEELEENIDEEFVETQSGTDVAFKMLIDPSVNGITLESLLKVCEIQEGSWTKQQVMEMMTAADLNHDGMIDSNEFRILCEKAGF